jgi:hypothetical protein
MNGRSPRVLWLALLISCAFGLGWWTVPSGGSPSTPMVARAERWSSPSVPRAVDLLQLATTLGVSPFWGAVGQGSSTPAPQAPPAPAWWIAGTYGAESARTVLVRFSDPNLPPLKVGVGGLLPSGHRIVSVREADVCIQIGDGNYMLGVERRER